MRVAAWREKPLAAKHSGPVRRLGLVSGLHRVDQSQIVWAESQLIRCLVQKELYAEPYLDAPQAALGSGLGFVGIYGAPSESHVWYLVRKVSQGRAEPHDDEPPARVGASIQYIREIHSGYFALFVYAHFHVHLAGMTTFVLIEHFVSIVGVLYGASQFSGEHTGHKASRGHFCLCAKSTAHC